MTSQFNQGELLSPKEVLQHSKVLGFKFKYRTLLNMIRRGELAHVNFGTKIKPRYYITEDSIEQWKRNKKNLST